MAEIYVAGPAWCLDRRTAFGNGNKYSHFPRYGRKFKLVPPVAWFCAEMASVGPSPGHQVKPAHLLSGIAGSDLPILLLA